MSSLNPPQFAAVARPLTSRAVFDQLQQAHEQMSREFELEGKTTADWVPAWYAHLPSGDKFRIKRITRTGPLIRFTANGGSFVVLAPDAVVVSVERLPEDKKGFPIEFLDSPDEGPDEEEEAP